MRQGSDQLLSVTTGWYQGPVVGSGGTCNVVALEVGDSGSAASAERDTRPAPIAAAAPPRITRGIP